MGHHPPSVIDHPSVIRHSHHRSLLDVDDHDGMTTIILKASMMTCNLVKMMSGFLSAVSCA
eukprot:12427099-Karenia_brevis.AAC.1